MEGRKVPPHYENPFDNILIYLAEKTNPFWKALNYTPNTLTTFSLMLGIISAYALYKGQYLICAVTFFISYYFDTADGNFARTYKMYTDFGDKYDHFTDFSKLVLLVVGLFYCPLPNKQKIIIAVVSTTLALLAFVHYGCQEKVFDNKGVIMDFTQGLCPDVKMIQFTRWFGVGTCITFIVVYLSVLQFQDF